MYGFRARGEMRLSSSREFFFSFVFPTNSLTSISVINAEQAALLAPVFQDKSRRTRNVILADLVETALLDLQKK